jgi:hypothetical protein
MAVFETFDPNICASVLTALSVGGVRLYGPGGACIATSAMSLRGVLVEKTAIRAFGYEFIEQYWS